MPTNKRVKERELELAQERQQETTIALGQPYEGIPGPREEGVRYNFRYGYHTLSAFFNRPTPEEQRLYQEAPVKIGFWKDGPVMWAVFHIEGLGWHDAPYTPHLVEPEGRIVPELKTSDSRYPVTMLLGDAEDGVIVSLRVATLSPETSRLTAEITKELIAEPYDPEEYRNRIHATYRRYPESALMKDLPPRMEQLGAP